MSFLQNIVGQIFGGQSQNQQQNLLQSVASMLNSPEIGGISGLADKFRNQGLGQVVAGWISRGPNPPISANQLEEVLGPGQIDEVARKMGVSRDEAATKLAATLPHAVDQLTPDGTIPQNNMSTQDIFSALADKFLSSMNNRPQA